MISTLAQIGRKRVPHQHVAIGDYVVTTSPGPNGVTIRNAVDAAVGDDVTVAISRTAEMIS